MSKRSHLLLMLVLWIGLAPLLTGYQLFFPNPVQAEVSRRRPTPTTKPVAKPLVADSPVVSADAILTVSTPDGPVNVGQSFTVDILVNSAWQTRSASLAISFDPLIMRCDSFTVGSFYSDWASANGASTLIYPKGIIDNDQGAVSEMDIYLLGGPMSKGIADGPSGSGQLASYQFTALADGASNISLTTGRLTDTNAQYPKSLTVTLQNGQVSVWSNPTSTTTATAEDVTATPSLSLTETTAAPQDLTATSTPTPAETTASSQDVTTTPSLSPTETAVTPQDMTATLTLPPAETSPTAEDVTTTPSLTPMETTATVEDVSPTPSLSVSATSTQTAVDLACQASDVGGYGVVNIVDVTSVGGTFGQIGIPGWIAEDVNQDGVVNILDITRVGGCFGKVVGRGATSTATPIAAQLNLFPICFISLSRQTYGKVNGGAFSRPGLLNRADQG